MYFEAYIYTALGSSAISRIPNCKNPSTKIWQLVMGGYYYVISNYTRLVTKNQGKAWLSITTFRDHGVISNVPNGQYFVNVIEISSF